MLISRCGFFSQRSSIGALASRFFMGNVARVSRFFYSTKYSESASDSKEYPLIDFSDIEINGSSDQSEFEDLNMQTDSQHHEMVVPPVQKGRYLMNAAELASTLEALKQLYELSTYGKTRMYASSEASTIFRSMPRPKNDDPTLTIDVAISIINTSLYFHLRAYRINNGLLIWLKDKIPDMNGRQLANFAAGVSFQGCTDSEDIFPVILSYIEQKMGEMNQIEMGITLRSVARMHLVDEPDFIITFIIERMMKIEPTSLLASCISDIIYGLAGSELWRRNRVFAERALEYFTGEYVKQLTHLRTYRICELIRCIIYHRQAIPRAEVFWTAILDHMTSALQYMYTPELCHLSRTIRTIYEPFSDKESLPGPIGPEVFPRDVLDPKVNELLLAFEARAMEIVNFINAEVMVRFILIEDFTNFKFSDEARVLFFNGALIQLTWSGSDAKALFTLGKYALDHDYNDADLFKAILFNSVDIHLRKIMSLSELKVFSQQKMEGYKKRELKPAMNSNGTEFMQLDKNILSSMNKGFRTRGRLRYVNLMFDHYIALRLMIEKVLGKEYHYHCTLQRVYGDIIQVINFLNANRLIRGFCRIMGTEDFPNRNWEYDVEVLRAMRSVAEERRITIRAGASRACWKGFKKTSKNWKLAKDLTGVKAEAQALISEILALLEPENDDRGACAEKTFHDFVKITNEWVKRSKDGYENENDDFEFKF